jgi:hypothetical protein
MFSEYVPTFALLFVLTLRRWEESMLIQVGQAAAPIKHLLVIAMFPQFLDSVNDMAWVETTDV